MMLFIAIIMNIKVKNIRTKRKSIKENIIRDIIKLERNGKIRQVIRWTIIKLK